MEIPRSAAALPDALGNTPVQHPGWKHRADCRNEQHRTHDDGPWPVFPRGAAFRGITDRR